MKQPKEIFLSLVGISLVFSSAAYAAVCPNDSVPVGPICVDKYEASIWSPRFGDAAAAQTLQNLANIGNAKLSDLKNLGAIQRGINSDDYDAAGCPDSAAGCTQVYAFSIPGVFPSTGTTWFQAAAACRNSTKRMLENEEWQLASLGTPDSGGSDNGITTCNTDAPASNLVLTGSRSDCVSDMGAFDMVGNAQERVREWERAAQSCQGWGTFSDDMSCFSGAAVLSALATPQSLNRGGHAGLLSLTGPYAIDAQGVGVTQSRLFTGGFRCGRPQ